MQPTNLPSLFSLITPHQLQDICYWLAFFCGQCLFVLKRADLSTRKPTNATKSRRAYVANNWVPLLIRMIIEFVVIFYPYRHFSLVTIASWFGWHLPFDIPQSGFGAFCLGFLSDGLLDWLGTLQTIPKTNIAIPAWIKEQIPPLNGTPQ
jgi:hypothetical protein